MGEAKINFLASCRLFKRQTNQSYLLCYCLNINTFSLIFIALSFKVGRDNITTTAPGLFACKDISFQNPFYGRKQIKVFASLGHTEKSQTHRYGASVWVENVKETGFTACIVEYGEGSNGTAEVNWIALQSAPPGSQLGTAPMDTWTTGTECKKIVFKKVSETVKF